MMTTLRTLVGAGSVLAFMGFVVFVPLGWALVLYVHTGEKASVEQLKARTGIGGPYTVGMAKGKSRLP
jgi:hypothetical protein